MIVTGVLNDRSIAFAIAAEAQRAGADILLTSFGRVMSKTRRAARKLLNPVDVLQLDVTDEADLADLENAVRARWDRVDGVVHAIAFAPESCIGGPLSRASWDDVAVAVRASAYSLAALATAVRPLMPPGSAIVGLDFDAAVAWPEYNWMGVSKAALESVARYLARDLGPSGIRVNLIASGPVRTMSSTAIRGFDFINEVWEGRAPLGWDVTDPAPVARTCVALLSDLFPATTGEIVHVDGGFHAMGV